MSYPPGGPALSTPRDLGEMKRRDLLLSGGSVLAAAATVGPLALATATSAFAQQPASRPNIVYIVADDLGWKDVGFHGSDIKTPNIDKLGAERGAARTVLRPADVHADASGTADRPLSVPLRPADRWSFRSGQPYGLPTDEWLLPQALKEAGYKTAMVGKWHLGPRRPQVLAASARVRLPLWIHWSARSIISPRCITGCIRTGTATTGRSRRQGYVDPAMGQGRGGSIEGHDPRSRLFLYLAFTAPHTPYQAPKQYLDRYRHIEDPTRRAYAAHDHAMDDEIGHVVAALDKKKHA